MTPPDGTIAAIATAPGAGGVAIIRVSGPAAALIASKIFQRRRGFGLPEVRRVYVGRVLDAVTGAVLDQALAFRMCAPQSYTGEDIVEIQCHGGSIVSRRVLESVCAVGARPAEPGEFTKRAFLNGRIDLAQAEAVADLITARSESGRRLAWSQLDGTLSARIERLREAILMARAFCEASLDFPEDDLPELSTGTSLDAHISEVRAGLDALTQSFDRGRLRYEGARIALLGRPNVGKSSLLNALAGRDRALVTAIAGTTRDVVEASIVIDGAPMVLMDTAGIRETGDVVEALGVARSRHAIEDSACVLAVFDRSAPLSKEDALVADMVKTRPVIVVLNKADLPMNLWLEDVRRLLGSAPMVEVSATTGSGLAKLGDTIGRLLLGSDQDPADDEVVLFRVRHREAARRAVEDLSRAEAALVNGAPLELVASDLAAAATALGDITGEMTSEHVLDRVFADFCIGK